MWLNEFVPLMVRLLLSMSTQAVGCDAAWLLPKIAQSWTRAPRLPTTWITGAFPPAQTITQPTDELAVTCPPNPRQANSTDRSCVEIVWVVMIGSPGSITEPV